MLFVKYKTTNRTPTSVEFETLEQFIDFIMHSPHQQVVVTVKYPAVPTIEEYDDYRE